MQGYRSEGGKYVLHEFFEGKHPKRLMSEPVVRQEPDGKGGQKDVTVEEAKSVEIDEVAAAYLVEGQTLMTHGSREDVLAWVKLHNETSPAKAMALVFHPETSAEEITKALHDPEYFKTFIPAP